MWHSQPLRLALHKTPDYLIEDRRECEARHRRDPPDLEHRLALLHAEEQQVERRKERERDDDRGADRLLPKALRSRRGVLARSSSRWSAAAVEGVGIAVRRSDKRGRTRIHRRSTPAVARRPRRLSRIINLKIEIEIEIEIKSRAPRAPCRRSACISSVRRTSDAQNARAPSCSAPSPRARARSGRRPTRTRS